MWYLVKVTYLVNYWRDESSRPPAMTHPVLVNSFYCLRWRSQLQLPHPPPPPTPEHLSCTSCDSSQQCGRSGTSCSGSGYDFSESSGSAPHPKQYLKSSYGDDACGLCAGHDGLEYSDVAVFMTALMTVMFFMNQQCQAGGCLAGEWENIG
jgi:hypothetical protein